MRTLILVCLLAASTPFTPALAVDGDDLPVLKPKVKALAAFKNGLGFVFKTGKTELKNGWAALDQIPPASLGTLWIGTMNSQARVEEVLSYRTTSQTEVDAASLVELLETNVGTNVSLTYRLGGQGDFKQVTGILTAAAPASDDPLSACVSAYPRTQVLMIKADNGRILCINKSDVCAIELPGNATLKRKLPKDSVSAKLRVSGSSNAAEISMAYLERGVAWSPSYLINIADKSRAEMTMEAILLNDAEDLEDADVSFVVGFPSFLHANSLTPMYLQQSVAAFTSQLGSNSSMANAPLMANSMSQAVSYDMNMLYSTYTPTSDAAGESNQDLYMYNVPHVTMKKGDRARFAVFSATVPCKHTYIWDAVDVGASGRSPQGNPEQVWHAIKLTNDTPFPWTTAPGFVVNGSMPNAQNTLDYTPRGGTNTFRLTVATDVRAEQKQTEAIRRPIVINKVNYDELIIDGELTIRNFKNEPIKIDINKSLTGKVLSSGIGKAARIGSEQAEINPHSEINWDIELEAGKKQTLEYRYQVLIAR